MALNIKNERVHELAREAARRTGTSQTSALEAALTAYLAGLRHEEADLDARVASRAAAVRGLVVEFNRGRSEADRHHLRRAVDDLYDADGLPR